MRAVLLTIAVVGAIVAPPAGAEEPKPVSAAVAIKRVGQAEVVVEMVVKKAKDRLDKRGVIYLDSEDDFKDPNNLGVVLSAGAAAKLKAKGIADPAAHFLGKTVRVRGCVMKFEERPYLPVLDPAQLEIVEKR
ncbi:MAG TPA: hypothetical protein VKD90_09510 [Gemmataceae bacterium]|nr:hypothetical protein [Gemmataceae bacterium]